MYPTHATTAADLVPLPLCDGPKLQPFEFWDAPITFLEYLGEGLHSHVFKIDVCGKAYALKLFRFAYPISWYGLTHHPEVGDNRQGSLDLAVVRTAYDYLEPFNCECRAFGRLQESGHDDLAIDCYGYLLLSQANERAMMDKFRKEFGCDLRFDGDEDGCYGVGEDIRSRFKDADGKEPPLRGIVKAFGRGEEEYLTTPLARRMLRDTTRLHQLGIVWLDLDSRQYIDGKTCDFSTAVTSPHPLLTPELNPRLTPSQLRTINEVAFNNCIMDYIQLDRCVAHWNRTGARQNGKPQVPVYAFPLSNRHVPTMRPKYNLRKGRRLYTFVDPRTYDWKASSAGVRGRGLQSGQGIMKGRLSKARRRLVANPPKWYYEGNGSDWTAFYMGGYGSPYLTTSALYWSEDNGALFPVSCFDDGPGSGDQQH